MKANHNCAAYADGGLSLCSKNVRIKCESKSQPFFATYSPLKCCVQRTSGLNVKANHNSAVISPLAEVVVFKERPD